jgi:hypothetical protein
MPLCARSFGTVVEISQVEACREFVGMAIFRTRI